MASEHPSRRVGGNEFGACHRSGRQHVKQGQIDQKIERRHPRDAAEHRARNGPPRVLDLLAVDDQIGPPVVGADDHQHGDPYGVPPAGHGRHRRRRGGGIGLREEHEDERHQHRALGRGQGDLRDPAHPRARGIDQAEQGQGPGAHRARPESTLTHAKADEELSHDEAQDRGGRNVCQQHRDRHHDAGTPAEGAFDIGHRPARARDSRGQLGEGKGADQRGERPHYPEPDQDGR